MPRGHAFFPKMQCTSWHNQWNIALPLFAKEQWLKSVELASARKECHDFGQYLQEHGTTVHANVGNPLLRAKKKKREQKLHIYL